jgi:hypothetical protein
VQKAVVDNLKYDPVYEGLLQAVTTASKISHAIIHLDPSLSVEVLLSSIAGILRKELGVAPHNWTLYRYHPELQQIEIVDNNMGETFSRISSLLKNKNIHLPFRGAFFPVIKKGAYELALSSADPVVLRLIDVMKDYYPEFMQSTFFKAAVLPLALFCALFGSIKNLLVYLVSILRLWSVAFLMPRHVSPRAFLLCLISRFF